MFKKLKAYWNGKSVKQRIYIFIAVSAVLTLFIFTVKAYIFDTPQTDNYPQTEASETEDSNDEVNENVPETANEPMFHISLIDVGILLAVVSAYCVHKIREKKKQGRL